MVLYVEDLEASRAFYRALGLDLIREQHGRSPVHYSVVLAGGEVIELYPAASASRPACVPACVFPIWTQPSQRSGNWMRKSGRTTLRRPSWSIRAEMQ
ncbi:VOC family protein [Nocardia huaxiensis]|uniref:VOC family protein n=1 Tax=Nocardia huaxiensis TaxID=2755382 RepID=UPI003B8A8C4E